MAELFTAAVFLLVFSHFIMSFSVGFMRRWRELRIESAEERMAPFRYMEGKRLMTIIFVGMADVLSVKGVSVDTKGENIIVNIELAWWARSFGYFHRNAKSKAISLITDAGLTMAGQAATVPTTPAREF